MTGTPPRIEFYRGADGRRLAVRVWESSERASARVVLLHGITSHGGWYHQSCQHLARAGNTVHFLDRRGSGLNSDDPGDVDRWETWIDDVTIYVQGLEPPVVLGGISWGGKLAVAVARRHPGLLDGLVLICPGLFSPYGSGPLKKLALAGPMPARLAERRVRIPLGDPALFTDSLQWQQFVAQDPLSLRRVTWRFARADRALSRYARAAAPFLRLPTLLMLAGRDRIISNTRTRAFLARTAGESKMLIEYSNASHTLEFEPDPTRYCADLGNWIRDVAGPAA